MVRLTSSGLYHAIQIPSHIFALLVRAFLRINAAAMSNKNQENNKVINAFSPEYVSQIEPFRTKKGQPPVMDHGKYSILETIATPDEGKQARLRKASI